jgi:hypothetical protein
MKATPRPHDLGQGLWLNDIARDLLTGGTLHRQCYRQFTGGMRP